MSIVEEYKIEPGTNVVKDIRNIISLWSNGIPFHDHTNLGDKIKIREIIFTPVYKLNIITQFYSQHDERRDRPHSSSFGYAKSVPSYERKSFVRHAEVYTLPGSESIHTCTGCSGRGETSCASCSGSGNLTCSSCNGSRNCNQCWGSGKKKCYSCQGGTISCPSCGGRGGHYEYDSYTQTQVYKNCYHCSGGRVRCSSCYGRGETNCIGCAGSGRCNQCGGRGVTTCNTCNGAGKLTCAKCKGSGKIVHYVERSDRWDYSNYYDLVFSPRLQTAFKALSLKSDTPGDLIFKDQQTKLNSNLFTAEPPHFRSQYSGLLNKAMIPSGLTVQPNATMLEQYLGVSCIPAYYVTYDYDGISDDLIVFPKDKTVFEEEGPITRFRGGLVQDAHKHLKKRNYGKSAEHIEKAVKMGLDKKDPLLEKINNKVTIKIRAIYKIGAFTGAWLACYFIGLWLFSFFKSPAYVLGILNEIATDWGNDFLLVNNTVLILAITIISVVQCVKMADNTLSPFPGRQMKPEAMRFAVGFVTSIGYTVFIAATLLLLHFTGILIPFMKLIQWLVAVILPYVPFEAIKNLF